MGRSKEQRLEIEMKPTRRGFLSSLLGLVGAPMVLKETSEAHAVKLPAEIKTGLRTKEEILADPGICARCGGVGSIREEILDKTGRIATIIVRECYCIYQKLTFR